MRKTIAIGIPIILILLAGMLACDNSTPVAPEGSTIILSANPSDIQEVDGQGRGTSEIRATVLNASGIPQDNIAVFFSTNSGTLRSEGIAETTDENGRAFDLLTTRQSAQITAQSGTSSTQITVTVSGQVLVGSVSLLATSATTIVSGQKVEFQVTVTDTDGISIENALVTVTIPVGDGIPDFTPNNTGGILLTDSFGIAVFDVRNITMDGTQVFASSGGESSNTVTITVTPN